MHAIFFHWRWRWTAFWPRTPARPAGQAIAAGVSNKAVGDGSNPIPYHPSPQLLASAHSKHPFRRRVDRNRSDRGAGLSRIGSTPKYAFTEFPRYDLSLVALQASLLVSECSLRKQ